VYQGRFEARARAVDSTRRVCVDTEIRFVCTPSLTERSVKIYVVTSLSGL